MSAGFQLRRYWTESQQRAMRWQIDRAEEQCIRAGRRVCWFIDVQQLTEAR